MERQPHRSPGRFRLHGEWFEDIARVREKMAQTVRLRDQHTAILTVTVIATAPKRT